MRGRNFHAFPDGQPCGYSSNSNELIPSGGAAIVEFRAETTGDYHFVDNPIFRTQMGALGTIHVAGEPELAVFEGRDGPMAH